MNTNRPKPVIDMTPEGEFRDATPPRGTGPLDRALVRIGAAGVLVAAVAGGIMIVGLAILAISILLPVVLVAGSVGAVALWWRVRRARRNGTAPPTGARYGEVRR